eukprot:2571660-Rhodomonas_salina.1
MEATREVSSLSGQTAAAGTCHSATAFQPPTLKPKLGKQEPRNLTVSGVSIPPDGGATLPGHIHPEIHFKKPHFQCKLS